MKRGTKSTIATRKKSSSPTSSQTTLTHHNKSSKRTKKGLKKNGVAVVAPTADSKASHSPYFKLLFNPFLSKKKRGRGRPRKPVTIFSRWQATQHHLRRQYKAFKKELHAVLFQPNGPVVITPLPKNATVYEQPKPPRPPRFPWMHTLRFQLGVSAFFSLFILGTAYWTYVYIFWDLPSAEELVLRQQDVTTRILDRNGRVLYKVYEEENRTLIPLSQVPQHVVNATIAIEDKEFYDHPGFSVSGITRAALANIQGKPIQGGSTITQQLVKNRLLSPERTFRRKVRELVLAVLVDANFSKDEILTMYLNQVSYGGSAYGIEEAAQRYFGKPARQLSLAEGALLAGLPAAPSAYSPFGSVPAYAKVRQEEVLRRMVEDGYITSEQATEASTTQLSYKENTIDIKAPHFVMYVKQLLAEQYDDELVMRGGLEVRTTLDLGLQNQAQATVSAEVAQLRNYRITNGAALITKPQTGEILSMIGSIDYFDFSHDGQVNLTLRPRQPGSSIKPLTYAIALENGKTPATLIDDSPITYVTAGSPPYSPKNYDGKYHGRVTLRQSLASSYNIPAVKTLSEIGIQRFIDKAVAMGIGTWNDRSRFGLSLTLGGGEVLMSDMAEVYGTFANYGYTVNLNPILEIKDSHGQTLYRNTCALDRTGCPKRKTLDPRVAYQISDILSDNKARTPAFGPQSVLHIPGQQVAVKTGTTNSMRDNWTIGYTSEYVVAVWVGNNDNTPMSYVASGITGASPIWNKLIRQVLDPATPHQFIANEGLLKVAICKKTGTLPCSGCPEISEEYFLPGTQPTTNCNPTAFVPGPSGFPTATRAPIQQTERRTARSLREN